MVPLSVGFRWFISPVRAGDEDGSCLFFNRGGKGGASLELIWFAGCFVVVVGYYLGRGSYGGSMNWRRKDDSELCGGSSWKIQK